MVHEPIGFASQKFSNIASRWDAFKKEAYAAYYGVSHFAYYLRGKPFLLETDHRNLLWIEKSDVPIVVRWRVFLQSFVMFIRHVSGAKNTVADWLSRMHAYVSSEKINLLSAGHLDVACLMGSMLEYPGMREPVVQFAEEPNLVYAAGQEELPEQKVWTAEEMFKEIHGGRKLHWGARRTWQALNKRFPGHAISFPSDRRYGSKVSYMSEGPAGHGCLC